MRGAAELRSKNPPPQHGQRDKKCLKAPARFVTSMEDKIILEIQ